MAHDDQFTATGPAFTGSGISRAGFSTKRVADRNQDFVHGANVQGQRCGLYADSIAGRGDAEDRDSSYQGVGVHGAGDNFGIFGDGNQGIAGVYGRHNRGRAGVIGAVMLGGTGVVGLALGTLGNEVDTFQSIPSSADGDGTGVLGASGSGAGVLASSESGSGVRATSTSGDGLTAESSSGVGVSGASWWDVGGRFESQRAGQVWLVPRDAGSLNSPAVVTPMAIPVAEQGPEVLPRDVRDGGQLMAIKDTQGVCTLWFCVRAGPPARWAQVLVGPECDGLA